MFKFVREVAELLAPMLRYYRFVITRPKHVKYFGVSIPLSATNQLNKIRGPIYRNDYELDELEMTRSLLRTDDIVLEVGAGVGIVTTAIAMHLKDSSQIYCIEANPENISSITAVAAQNRVQPNVKNVALTRTDGSTEFYIDEQFLSSSSIYRHRSATLAIVESVAISRMFVEIQPTFLMFDIEGGEEIFCDCEFPKCLRVICGEFHPHIISNRQITLIVSNIVSQGFSLILEKCNGNSLAFERDV